ncbi:hypothetical protein BDB01DRAFT_729789 [Pilobolus umbonatus]|nr:hypothetical protein BDB01DRAFT_729789 [Pilobolus umbonatus]
MDQVQCIYTTKREYPSINHVRIDAILISSDDNEEDFISLKTETRQQRRLDERKRKRTDDEDEEDDEQVLGLHYPWLDLIPTHPIPPPLSVSLLLDREVKCLLEYLEPTKAEQQLREYLIHRIRETVKAEWPEATVEVFGSYSTSIYLPNSDLDLVVQFPPSVNPRLFKLSRVLERGDICMNPTVIERATVPVIKFEDVMTKIKVDIIMNSTNGLESCKRHPKVAAGEIDPMKNLGVLLLEFFQLYGINFHLGSVCIEVNGDGKYQYVSTRARSRNGVSVFSILDPLDKNNDIGNKSFHAVDITDIFKRCYNRITAKSIEIEAELKRNKYNQLDNNDEWKVYSFLKDSFFIPNDFLDHRELMQDVYYEKRWKGQWTAKSFKWK